MTGRENLRGKKTFTLLEVSQLTGLDDSTLTAFIRREWVCPVEEERMDEEDVAESGSFRSCDLTSVPMTRRFL